MIPLTKHDSRVRENSEVVIKFTQKYGIFMLIIMGLIWDEWDIYIETDWGIIID